MIRNDRTAYFRKDDKELLGFIAEENNSWVAETIFGHTIERTTSKTAAENVLRERGLSFLMGVWQYYDTDEHDWFSCVLKEANEHQVTVIRTTVMGHQDPDVYKLVTIKNPTDNNLVKSQ